MDKVSKHTPGPWNVHAAGCAHEPPFVRVAKFWPMPGAYQIIADCSHEATAGAECEANARLIAAAPDLLDALQMLLGEPADLENIEFAIKIIARARGES